MTLGDWNGTAQCPASMQCIAMQYNSMQFNTMLTFFIMLHCTCTLTVSCINTPCTAGSECKARGAAEAVLASTLLNVAGLTLSGPFIAQIIAQNSNQMSGEEVIAHLFEECKIE